MANLSTQTKDINIVIRKNVYIPKEKLEQWIQSLGVEFYAFIEHANDINLKGEKEGIHYHLVFRLLKRCRLSTILVNCYESLCFSNDHGIEIDKVKSYEGSIQYLIHKNDPNKTPHEVKDIVTNLAEKELSQYLEREGDTITFDKIYVLSIKSNSLLDVIKEVGFTRYNMYRNSILDIWNCCSAKRQERINKELQEKWGIVTEKKKKKKD